MVRLFAGPPRDGVATIVLGVSEANIERVEIGELGREELESLIDEAVERLRENAEEYGCSHVSDVRIEVGMYRVLRGLIKVVVVVYGTCIQGSGQVEV